MRIAIDLDNTVYKFTEEFLKYTNVRFNHTDDPANVDRWEFWESPNMQIGKNLMLPLKNLQNKRLGTKFPCLMMQNLLFAHSRHWDINCII